MFWLSTEDLQAGQSFVGRSPKPRGDLEHSLNHVQSGSLAEALTGLLALIMT